jgi:hypothetical protein
MSDKIEDIVIPILRTIQSDVSGLKTGVSVLKSDVSVLKSDMGVVKEAVRRIDARITTMDYYMASFYNEQHWQNSELEYLKSRIETKPDDPSG